jgi:preprotein translocase SecE subunit
LLSKRAGFQNGNQLEEVPENNVDDQQDGGDQEHEDDHDLGGAEQVLAARPVDLLHLAVGGDEEVDVGRLVHHPPAEEGERGGKECGDAHGDLPPRIPFLRENKNVAIAIAIGFLALAALVIFWFINRPNTADFLIATDSEMKKVNWTSRKDLIGSTRVVIIFMFLIAGLLFGIDIIFGYVFYWFGVLKNPPF